MQKFMDFFDESEDYPMRPCVDDEILPWGTSYNYVPDSFLAGFLNAPKAHLSVWLLGRYRALDDIRQPDELPRYSEGGRCLQPTQPMTKEQEIAWYIQPGRIFHTRLGMFRDDVLLLSRTEGGNYFYFWVDQDSSDCCIGRFRTTKPEAEVLALFDAYASGKDGNIDITQHKHPPLQLPLHFLSGWLST